VRVHRLSIVLAVAGGLLAVAGCNTTDPKQGGFFGGVGGMASGNYDDRIAQREASLARLKAAESDLSTQRTSLEAQESAKQAQIASLRSSIYRLDRETEALKRQVASLSAQDSASSARLQDLRSRLATLDRRISGVQSGADALEGASGTSADVIARRQALEAERQQLEREYKALLELSRQLAS
jgi:chromosome segregation ATPase